MCSNLRWFLCLAVFLSLHSLAKDRAAISEEIERRAGHGLGPLLERSFMPPEVSLEDGFSEDEAIAVALWNNAALRATLAGLNLAQADLVEAGLLVNPNLQILFGVGTKPFELLLTAPIELLWQRPKRVAAADLTLEAVAQRLTQNGLDLVRDVRRAHSDYVLAREQAQVAERAATLAEEIAELTSRRLRAGDIGELELQIIRLEALSARDRAEQLEQEAGVAWEQLRFLTGLPLASDELRPDGSGPPARAIPPSDDLLRIAASSRPDLRAAELSVEAAGKRLGWERSRVLAFLAPTLSSKGIGDFGIKTGPGLAAEVPVFNRNQGRRSRAQAELEQAGLRYAALRVQIESEVSGALVRLNQVRRALQRLRQALLPAAEEAVQLSEKAYEAGDISYLDVQIAKRPLLDLQLREAGAVAAVRRAQAELDRAVGRKL